MSNSVKWYIVGIVLSAAIMIALVPNLLRSTPEPQPTEYTEEHSVGETIAARPDCPTSEVGGVTLPCLGGTAGEATGRATVVNVWAWWCEPCRKELPLFDALSTARPDLNVVGVHADTNAANGAAMLNDLDVRLPSYQDDRNVFAAHHGLPSVVPITVVIAEDGTVRATYPHTFTHLEDLEDAVAKALA